MRGRRIGTMVAAASLLGGCAGVTHKDVSRLQSQVGLLDERVTQLEHAASAGPAPISAESMTEPAISSEPAPAKAERRHRSKGKHAAASATTAAVSAPAPSLKPTTQEIQQALKNAGFYQGAVDGKMGPMTRNAVQEFQRVHGLTDDGVVGKQTWEKLGSFADLSGKGGEANAAEVLK